MNRIYRMNRSFVKTRFGIATQLWRGQNKDICVGA